MIAQFMIDEIEGILILLGRPADDKMLNAIAQLPAEEIKAYRDSYAEEFHILNHNTHLLLMD
jgi:hypothetical protein